jgi:hypothetical protein
MAKRWPRRIEIRVAAPWLFELGAKSATFATRAYSEQQAKAFENAAECGYFSLRMAESVEWLTLAEGA